MDILYNNCASLLEYQGYKLQDLSSNPADTLNVSGYIILTGSSGKSIYKACIITAIHKRSRYIPDLISSIISDNPDKVIIFSDLNLTTILNNLVKYFQITPEYPSDKPYVSRVASLDKIRVNPLLIPPSFRKLTPGEVKKVNDETLCSTDRQKIFVTDVVCVWCDAYPDDIIEFQQVNRVTGINIVYRIVI